MQPVWEAVRLITFIVLMLAPCVYGLHLYALVFLAHRKMKPTRAAQDATIEKYRRGRREDQWPIVTTQIPIYNELAVARRIIEAVARMDYPAGRHEVQVLDDSNDETCAIVDETASRLRREGCIVSVVRRPNREHYKAGALQHGMHSAKGGYIAVFDADFVPDAGFLRRMIPLIESDPGAGCVQGRWGHLNAGETWITEGLSLGMNGHFAVEQPARAWNGFLLNFNGTGGIWRRAAIDDPAVGGWQGDTITEDLDLSYRAQLQGWRVIYRLDEICPAEVPADVDAVKGQQRRWATGSIQTACKLMPAVWRSKLSLLQKLEASIHLTGYCVSIFMILMAGAGQALLYGVSPERTAGWLGWTWMVVVTATVAPTLAYVYANYVLGERALAPIRIFKLMVLGMGLAVNNGFAVIVGLLTRGGEFVRTPKSGTVLADTENAGNKQSGTPAMRAKRPAYAAIRSQLYLVELALGTFCAVQGTWLLVTRLDCIAAGFMGMYATGFLSLGWASRPWAPRRTRADAATSAAVATESSVLGIPAAAFRLNAEEPSRRRFEPAQDEIAVPTLVGPIAD